MGTQVVGVYSSLGRVAQSALIVLVALGLLGPRAALAHPPGTTERVSVSSDGTEANSSNVTPAISANGRFVAFVSLADNLVPDDTNGFSDTFVHDRFTNVTERVSVDSRGREGNNHSGFLEGSAAYPAISADGRFVAFVSLADNLVPKDENQSMDVFVRDRMLGTTERISVSSTGEEAIGFSEGPAITADGRLIVFQSDAQNLVPGANPFLFVNQIYVHNRIEHTTEIVSVNNAGEAGNSSSIRAGISPDGRYIAFSSSADNLVPGPQFGHQVYLHDLLTDTTMRISEDAAGNPGDGTSVLPKVSTAGGFVVFETNTGNLIGDGNHELHVIGTVPGSGTFERISATSTGEPANFLSGHPDMSLGDRFVAFFSLASNLVPDDTNNRRDIFVKDRQTGTVVRVSESTAGEQGNSESEWPSISADAFVIAFQSNADNLVPEDTSPTEDIFVHDDRPPADLSVAKSDSPDPVAKGAMLTYSVVVTNNGPGPAITVQLTDQLPADVRFVSVTVPDGNCTEVDGFIRCERFNLAVGASWTVNIVVTPKKVSTITNTAQVSSMSPDPNPANNTDTEETTVVAR